MLKKCDQRLYPLWIINQSLTISCMWLFFFWFITFYALQPLFSWLYSRRPWKNSDLCVTHSCESIFTRMGFKLFQAAQSRDHPLPYLIPLHIWMPLFNFWELYFHYTSAHFSPQRSLCIEFLHFILLTCTLPVSLIRAYLDVLLLQVHYFIIIVNASMLSLLLLLLIIIIRRSVRALFLLFLTSEFRLTIYQFCSLQWKQKHITSRRCSKSLFSSSPYQHTKA